MRLSHNKIKHWKYCHSERSEESIFFCVYDYSWWEIFALLRIDPSLCSGWQGISYYETASLMSGYGVYLTHNRKWLWATPVFKWKDPSSRPNSRVSCETKMTVIPTGANPRKGMSEVEGSLHCDATIQSIDEERSLHSVMTRFAPHDSGRDDGYLNLIRWGYLNLVGWQVGMMRNFILVSWYLLDELM